MLAPVANPLDLRRPFDKDRARRVQAAMKEYRVGFSDVGYFDNMLHHDGAIRKNAILHGVLCVTTLTAAAATVQAIGALRGRRVEVTSLQEIHAARRTDARLAARDIAAAPAS